MLSNSVRSRGLVLLTATATALTFLGLAAIAPQANAATFCVNSPAGCSGTAAASIGAAITAAAGSGGTDRIEIASGNYSDGPWTVAPGNPVRIYGIGPTKPVLTGDLSSAGAVLTIDEAGSTISNVAIEIPSSSGKTGLYAGENIEAIGVSVTGNSAVNAIGVAISGNNSSKIEKCDVDLDWGVGNDTMAVWLNTASSTRVYESTLRATAGILAETSNFLDLQRLKVTANRGVEFRNSNGTLSSSLLRHSTPSAPATYQYGIRINNNSGGAYSVNSANNTILGHGAAASAGLISTIGGSGGSNTWAVNSNLIQGWTAATTDEVTAGTSTFNISHSRYDVIPASGLLAGNAQLSGDPGFVNAAGGDFSLLRGSSLVDAGDPAAIVTTPQPQPSGRDLAGNDRQVNAIGTDAASRDIGAYEVQNAAPTASIAVLTADPQTGHPVSFSSAGSSEPDGDSLTYLWTFDDGSTSAGPTAERLWQVVGIQTAKLTVTDSTGLSHTASVQVNLKKGTATLKLPTATSKVDRQGRFAYRLGCPAIATGACTGRLTFKTAGKVDVKRFGANTLRANKKIVKAAQYVYTIKPGETKTLRVTTYRTFLKLLKKKRKVRLRATLTGNSENLILSAEPADFTVKR